MLVHIYWTACRYKESLCLSLSREADESLVSMYFCRMSIPGLWHHHVRVLDGLMLFATPTTLRKGMEKHESVQPPSRDSSTLLRMHNATPTKSLFPFFLKCLSKQSMRLGVHFPRWEARLREYKGPVWESHLVLLTYWQSTEYLTLGPTEQHWF
jgi:hypothetical protein